MAGMIGEVLRREPWLAARLLGLSLVGSGLQAAALIGLLLVLRRLEGGVTIELAEANTLLGTAWSVHAYTALSGLVVLLVAGGGVMLAAERTAYGLARAYANGSGARLLSAYPAWAEAGDVWSIDRATGVPRAMAKRTKRGTVALERAVRLMVGSPLQALSFLWTGAILLWLEPLLTLGVVALLLPLIWPVRRIALRVKELEVARKGATSAYVDEVEGRLDAALAEGRAGVTVEGVVDSVGRLTVHRYLRLRAEAANRFYGLAGLGAGIVGAMVYFRWWYGEAELPVAQIVVYFATLQVAMFSGTSLVSKATRFAKFYRRVKGHRDAWAEAMVEREVAGVKLPMAVKGPDVRGVVAEAEGEADAVKVKRDEGVLAAVGWFPLRTVSGFAATTVLDVSSKRFGAAVAATAVVDGADAAAVAARLAEVREEGAGLVVMTERAAAALGAGLDAAVAGLGERWVAVYYELETEGVIGRFGEAWAAVVGAGVGGGPALGPSAWVDGERKAVRARVQACISAAAVDEEDDDEE
ncbi:MAG: hypothetical protein AAF797_17485 [Planctomycetota bacterium]